MHAYRRVVEYELEPFGLTVADVLDVGELGYDYDLLEGLEAVVIGAAGARSDTPSLSGGLGFEDYADRRTLIAPPLPSRH